MKCCQHTKPREEKMTPKEVVCTACKVILVLGVLLLSRTYFNAKFHPDQLEQDLVNTDEVFYQAIAEVVPAVKIPGLAEVPVERGTAGPDPSAEDLSDYDRILYQSTEKLCSLREEYNEKFHQMEMEAERVMGTMAEEDRDTPRQHALGLYFMSVGTNLERDYLFYGQQIQVTLQQLFLRNDEDPVMADALFQAYRTDLSTRKVYYMSMINRTYFEYQMKTPF